MTKRKALLPLLGARCGDVYIGGYFFLAVDPAVDLKKARREPLQHWSRYSYVTIHAEAATGAGALITLDLAIMEGFGAELHSIATGNCQ